MQMRAQAQEQARQRQRKRPEGGSRTLGGTRLRALRQAAGRTQLWVEAEAEIGSGYLQRIESGKIAQPERATLERILTALQARYSEQREILEAFGYAAPTLPPSTEDLAWARASCRQELDAVPFPAYALDCLPRLISWNRAVPRLFGLDSADPTLGGLAECSLLEAWFEPASPLAPLVAEPDLFLPTMIRAFRHEMRPFHDEAWYAALLARLLALPRFRHYWQVVEREPAPAGPARALMPVRLRASSRDGGELLQFRLASEPFTRDARFRLVYYPGHDAPLRRVGKRDGSRPMTTAQVDQYLYLLDAAFDGRDWHSVLRNLGSVKPEEWSWVPPGGRRSIQEIVAHLASCKLMYENHAFGDADLRWDDPLVRGDDALNDPAATLAWLRQAQARLRDSVAALDDDELPRPRRTNWGEEKETRWIIATMIQHDLYHAGEINHIRALCQGNDS